MKPILAISTPIGKSAIGIIRISFGTLNQVYVNHIILNLFNKTLKPNYFTYVVIRNKKKILDKGLAVYFKSPRSYTGEDILEYHGHGNYLNLKLILKFLKKKFFNFGLKTAKPGEFSKRAFINNKLNLFQLENLFNIINSNNNYLLNLIHKSCNYNFYSDIKHITNDIKGLIFFIENNIFTLKKKNFFNINYKLNYIIKKLLKIFKNSKFFVEKKFLITLWGLVNVGKSTLINKIIRTNYSITSSQPGTTRDSLKNYIYINNFLVCFIDTAGINYIYDKINNLSIKLSIKNKKKSRILIFIFDNFLLLLKSKKKIKNNQYIILIFNKIDLIIKWSNLEIYFYFKKYSFISLSSKFNLGLIFLYNELIRLIYYFNKTFTSLNLNILLKKKIYFLYKKILNCIDYNKKKLNFLLLNELKIFFFKINSLIKNKINLKKINIIFNSLCIGK